MTHCKSCLKNREMLKAKEYFKTEKINNNKAAQKGMSV
jgi:hypothetical protein